MWAGDCQWALLYMIAVLRLPHLLTRWLPEICSYDLAGTVQGMARVRPGQALAWPLVLTGGGAEAPTLKGGS